MITVAVAELRAALTSYLEQVQAGEPILVTDQGKEIARLVPAMGARLASPEYDDMVTSGVLIPPEKKASPEFWRLSRISDPEGLLVKAVLAEREEG